MSRIILASSHERRQPTCLIVSAKTSVLVEELKGKLLAKGCKVVLAGQGSIALASYDYIILMHLVLVPSVVSTLLKRCQPKLLFLDSSEVPANDLTYAWLERMSRDYSIRFIRDIAKKTSAEELLKYLFSRGEKKVLDHLRPTKATTKPTQTIKQQGGYPFKNTPDTSSSIFAPESSIVHPFVVEKRLSFPRMKIFLWGTFIAFVLLLLLAPLLLITARLGFGVQGLLHISDSMARAELNSNEIGATEEQFQSARGMLTFVDTWFGFLTNTPPYRGLEEIVATGEHITKLSRHALSLTKLGKDISAGVLSGEPISLSDSVGQMTKELDGVEGELSKTEQSLSAVENSPLLALPGLSGIKAKILSTKTKVGDLESTIKLGQLLLPILPDALGLKSEKTYLLLFQNNMELRPGGGFIGSYGIIKLKNGKQESLTVEDVYSADGQLKGHVEPPEAFKRYLAQEHWYMRDANFDPDFPTSARQVEWFLEKEVGKKVDGVIALDLTSAQYLVDALGGIHMTDYNEDISGENLFLKAQAYSQRDFFPGSTRKKDFLGSLSRSIIFELTSNTNLPWFRLGKALKRSLDEKHILLAFHDTTLQKAFDSGGWSGRLAPVVCLETVDPCTADYFSISEANMGVNKANAYLKRGFNQYIGFEKDKVKRQVTISYTNGATAQDFPAGDYKGYVRVLLPKTAGDALVQVDGKRLAENDRETREYDDKFMQGFLLTIPTQEKRVVTITYTLPLAGGSSQQMYQLLAQKQPGTDVDPLDLSIGLHGVSIVQTNFPLESNDQGRYNAAIVGNRIAGAQSDSQPSYRSDLSLDRLFRITIKQ